MTIQTNFSFKVLNVGSFYQNLIDQITILNRPCIFLDETKKRYGNEYILFTEENKQAIESGKEIFLGFFGIDQKKKRKYIRLYKHLNIPIKVPDYYIYTMEHEGEKLDKDYDFIKSDPNSHSQIFSSAFSFDKEKEIFNCQSIFVLRNGDIVTLNSERYTFSSKEERIIKI